MLEPVTLLEAHAQCKYVTDDQDPELLRFIVAARAYAESDTRRRLITQTVDCTFDWQWPWRDVHTGHHNFRHTIQKLELSIAPIQQITSVKYVDGFGATQTLDPSAYQVVIEDDRIPYICAAYGTTWPTVRWQPQAITVRVVAGYGDNPDNVPGEIRQAIRLLIAHFDANREAVQVTTRSGAPNAGDEMPLGVQALLSHYRMSRIL